MIWNEFWVDGDFDELFLVEFCFGFIGIGRCVGFCFEFCLVCFLDWDLFSSLFFIFVFLVLNGWDWLCLEEYLLFLLGCFLVNFWSNWVKDEEVVEFKIGNLGVGGLWEKLEYIVLLDLEKFWFKFDIIKLVLVRKVWVYWV